MGRSRDGARRGLAILEVTMINFAQTVLNTNIVIIFMKLYRSFFFISLELLAGLRTH